MSTKQNRFYNDVIQDYTRIVWLMFSVEIMILLRLSNLIYCLPFWESYAINSTNKVELMICEVRIEQCLNQMLIAKVLYIWSNASHCSPLIGSNGCQTIWHIGSRSWVAVLTSSSVLMSAGWFDSHQRCWCESCGGGSLIQVSERWCRVIFNFYWLLMAASCRWFGGPLAVSQGGPVALDSQELLEVCFLCGVLPHWVLHTRSGKCRQFCGTLLHINPNENDIGTFYLYLAYFERLSKSDALLLNPGSCLWIKRFN